MYYILRTESFVKLFFLICSTGLFLYAGLAFYTFHTAYSNLSYLHKYGSKLQGLPNTIVKVDYTENNLKYILLWTSSNTSDDYGEGLFPFIDNKCEYTNCYFTTNKKMLHDYRNFHAIVFNPENMNSWGQAFLPLNRSSEQKYVFYSLASADDYPVCHIVTDDYFNWTCTYRLDSDIFQPFLEVRDLDGNYVAPKEQVQWKTNTVQLTHEEISFLSNKTKAVAWIVNKCSTRNDRFMFAKHLQGALKEHSLTFDIYGCGNLECPKGGCLKLLKDYYFYFAAEESDDKDYVTKEIFKAYRTLAVPIVKGGADYHRFVPEGSYINAGKTTIDRLAAVIDYTIRNPGVYNDFHTWRKYYTINPIRSFHGICKICEFLNIDEKFNKKKTKIGFRKWWYNGPLFERCYPKGAESLASVLSYTNKNNTHT